MTTKRWKASADDKLQVLAGRTTIVYHFSLRWLTGIEPVLYASLQVSKVLGSKKQSLFLSQNYILKTKAFTPWLLIKLIIYHDNTPAGPTSPCSPLDPCGPASPFSPFSPLAHTAVSSLPINQFPFSPMAGTGITAFAQP